MFSTVLNSDPENFIGGAQTGILGTFFQKSANGIVFVEKNGSRINIKHKVNTISLMDRILRPTICFVCNAIIHIQISLYIVHETGHRQWSGVA